MNIAALLLTPATCTGVADGNGGYTIPLTDQCAGGTAPSIADNVGSTVVGGWMQGIADWVQSGMADIATSVASFWTSTPTVGVGGMDGNPSDIVGFIRDHLAAYAALIAVASVIIAGIKLALGQKQTLGELAAFLGRLVLAGAFSIAVVAALIDVTDKFSTWIISEASPGTDLGANLAALFANPVTGPVGFICLLILFLSSLWMVAMMWIRSAVLVLAVGVLPLSAAVLSPAWFGRMAKTVLAVLLVKPFASLILAVGFRLMGQNMGTVGVTETIVGAVVVGTAAWSWKFLVKIIQPYDDPMPQMGLGGAVARVATFAAIVAK